MRSFSRTLHCPQKRFSLIEGLLAIVLIAIIMVGAAPFFYFSRFLIQRSKFTREAVELATHRQEELLDLSFDQIVDSQQNVQLDGASAVMTTDVNDVVIDGDGNGYKRVAVSVSWTMGGKGREVALAAPAGFIDT